MLRVHNDLRRFEQIPDRKKLEEFKEKKNKIKAENPQHGPIYNKLSDFYMENKLDLFFDSLEQMAFRFKRDTTSI